MAPGLGVKMTISSDISLFIGRLEDMKNGRRSVSNCAFSIFRNVVNGKGGIKRERLLLSHREREFRRLSWDWLLLSHINDI